MSNPSGSTNQTAYNSSNGHSLPPRPPAAQQAVGFSFKPRNVTTPNSAVASSTPQTYTYPQQGFPANNPSASDNQNYSSNSTYPAQQNYNNYDYNQYNQSQPSIRNPFPLNGTNYEDGYNPADAEYQSQLAQWQSNYTTPSIDTKTGTSNRTDTSSTSAQPLPIPVPGSVEKTVVREGGGQKWEDSTLLEWGNHHRIFIGNLAGEVTDDSLLKAFAKYPSVQKAKVIRDKRTTKSKGFGFVSFSDADEYFAAAKEMNGKYIGSHPVLIRRAETEIKSSTKKDNGRYGNNKNKRDNKSSGQGRNGGAGGLGVHEGSGVKKSSAIGKTESKYKVLG